MFSTESYYETIKENVSKVNYSWFLKKKEEFKNEKMYDSKKEKIFKIFTNSDVQYDEDYVSQIPEQTDENCKDEEIPQPNNIGFEIFERETIIDINIRQYCNRYLPIDEMNGWGCFPMDEHIVTGKLLPSNNICEFSKNLLDDILSITVSIKDVSAINKFVSKVIEDVENEIKILKLDRVEEEYKDYHEVLNDFLNEFTSRIYSQLARQLTVYNLTNGYKGKLEFKLNQNELLSLLYIIQTAGFLNYDDQGPLLHFCLEHFLYSDDNKKMTIPSSIKNLQKKYSAISSTQKNNSIQVVIPTGLHSIQKRLEKVFKNLS